GADISTFLKQWNEMGMKDKIPFAQIGVADADIWGIGAEAAAGVYAKISYYDNPENLQEDKDFAATYAEKYGRPPPDRAGVGWFSRRPPLQGEGAAEAPRPRRRGEGPGGLEG